MRFVLSLLISLLAIACTHAQAFEAGELAITNPASEPCTLVGTSMEVNLVMSNLTVMPLTVRSITTDDTVHFSISAPPLPLELGPGGQLTMSVTYRPTAVETNTTIVRVRTDSAEYTAFVSGCGMAQGSVSVTTYEALEAMLAAGKPFAWLAPTPNPAERSTPVRFVFGLSLAETVKLELFDLKGNALCHTERGVYSEGIHSKSLSLLLLPAGTYLYRYTVGKKHYAGKLSIL